MLLTVLSSATCQVNRLELSTPDPLKPCRTHCRMPRSSSPPCPIWRLPRILTHLWHHGDTFHRVYPRLTPASRAAVVAMSPSEISRRHRSSLKRQPARDTHWQVRGERGTRTGRESAIAKRGVVDGGFAPYQWCFMSKKSASLRPNACVPHLLLTVAEYSLALGKIMYEKQLNLHKVRGSH